MEANKCQILRNQRKRRRTVMEDSVPKSGVLDITLDKQGRSNEVGDKSK